MPAKSGRRHPLLVYQRLFSAWRVPALLICLGSGALWWLAPAPLNTIGVRLALLAACGVAGVLFIYTLLGPRLSYVQCRPNHLLVSTPLYKLAVSYRRIQTTRPVPFKPADVRASRRWLVDPYRGLTALAVDLNGFPVARRFLRLWLNEFVLPADLLGLLLVTPDWMALSRDIESFRSTWKTHRKDAGKDQNPLTSLSSRQY
jgi:hypothetical protein